MCVGNIRGCVQQLFQVQNQAVTALASATTRILTQREKNMTDVQTSQCQEGHVRWLVSNVHIFCQAWKFTFPHSHKYTTLGGQGNNCRNPSSNVGGPWWGIEKRLELGLLNTTCQQGYFMSWIAKKDQLAFIRLDSRCYTMDPDKRWEFCPDMTCSTGE